MKNLDHVKSVKNILKVLLDAGCDFLNKEFSPVKGSSKGSD